MSRARIPYDFCPLPRKWHAGWSSHQGLYAQGLRNTLFEFADGGPIPIHGNDWLASVCNQLCIHGKDRPNVRRALKQFEADGLISFDGTHVHGRFLPDSGPLPVRADSTLVRVEVRSTSSRNDSESCQPIPLPLESTPRNDSTHVSQTDRRDRQKDERENAGARTREAPPIPRSDPETLWRKPLPAVPPDVRVEPAGPLPHVRVWRLYAQALNTDAALLGAVDHRSCTAIADAVTAAVGASAGAEWDATVQRLLAAWRSDRYVRERAPGLRNLAEQMARYQHVLLQGKPALAVVKCDPEQERARKLEQARSDLAWRQKLAAKNADAPGEEPTSFAVGFQVDAATAALRVAELEQASPREIAEARADLERLRALQEQLNRDLDEACEAILRGEAVAS